ncbi:MAG: hypothetical protein ABJE99_00485 [Roseobacter sp.]
MIEAGAEYYGAVSSYVFAAMDDNLALSEEEPLQETLKDLRTAYKKKCQPEMERLIRACKRLFGSIARHVDEAAIRISPTRCCAVAPKQTFFARLISLLQSDG